MDEDQENIEFPEMPMFGGPESPFSRGNNNVSEDPETLERFASYWKWNTSEDVILNNFPEARVRTESGGEVKIYELNTHTAYLFPKAHSARFQEGVRFYGVIRLVISTDGAKLLKAHKEELESKSIAREDITLYLEDNTGDVLSDTVMLINAGDIAQQRLYDGTGVYNFVNDKHNISREQFKELLSYTKDTGLLISFIAHAVSGLYDVISFVPNKVAKLLDSLTGYIKNKARIDESVWNPKKRKHAEGFGDVLSAIESRLNLVNDKVSKLTGEKSTIVPVAMKESLRTLQDILRSFHSFSRSLADGIQDTVELYIAFICGVWNALIDLVNGLLTICSLLLKAPGAIGHAVGNYDEFSYFYLLFKEYMDNFIQSVAAINWSEVFSEIVTGFKDIVLSIPAKLQKLTAAEVGYYTGYIAFNVAEFFFPLLKIAKLAKAGKLAEGFAEMVADMSKVAQKMANAGRKVGRTVTQAPKKTYDFLLEMIDNFTNLLRQGTATVKELVQKVFEKLRAWLDDLIYGLKNTKLYKTYSATWDLLNELGARIVRNIDDNLSGGLAVATPDGFVVRYGNKPIFEGTEEALEKFLNKMEGIRKNPSGKGGGKSGVKRELDELAEAAKYKTLLDEAYDAGYSYDKITLPKLKDIKKIFGKRGMKLYGEVNRQVRFMRKTLTPDELDDLVLVSGMTCKKYVDDVVMYTNFSRIKMRKFLKANKITRQKSTLEDIKSIYEYMVKHKHIEHTLHPFLEKKLAYHFKKLGPTHDGIKHSNYLWRRTGDLPGTHSEVLCLNELLWRIENKGYKITDDIMEEMIGFNRNLKHNDVMIRCGDCNFLTFGIKFIEKIAK